MTKLERESLVSSIEYLADKIAKEQGADRVDSILTFYEVGEIEKISDCDLWAVFGDLQQIDAD